MLPSLGGPRPKQSKLALVSERLLVGVPVMGSGVVMGTIDVGPSMLVAHDGNWWRLSKVENHETVSQPA